MSTGLGSAAPRTLARRLVPLQVGVGLQGFILWVPVEKLFMTQIGFTPQSVALMAAAYAAVVPLLEVPSGILADRWSRNWILVCASAALLASSLLGGLSRNVPTYIAAAMVLGVYFALNSGTVDSMVYDVVLEETGSSDLYERWIGRIRMVESGAFVASALAGGVLAGWSSARLTYFATLPFAAIAIAAFLRFDEPRLHRAAEPAALRSHIAVHVQDDDPRTGRAPGHPAGRARRAAHPGRFRVRPRSGWLPWPRRPRCSARTGRPWSPHSASAATSRASWTSTAASP